MDTIKVIIDGIDCVGTKMETILQIAQKNGIYIPTLCEEESLAHYGACGLCLVEAEGLPKLMRACSTVPQDGWILHTDSERVLRARKIALELLMSDHQGDCKGPCSLHCPAGTDCMRYVNAIAKGDYHGAVRIIKEKFPLPASIGHVCPHPCEDACRRQFVEEPISIAYLKRYAGLMDLKQDTWMPECLADTGKRVSIIGGGPAGLTAAYFLRISGHEVTVYEQMPKMGGMLRYGIPAYRLPKNVVDRETALIEALGVRFCNNCKIGTDISFAQIQEKSDAVIVAIGAWKSAGIGCSGEETEGVYGGIDFLRSIIEGKETGIGRRVAVVGGGNTAMDACRSAIRLGAEQVYVIYRRTREEMPADDIEIEEAIEEGVTFKFLTAPDEILSENGHVSGVRLQLMELGEPDESGRRKPLAVNGKTETLSIDTVISAIGQRVNAEGLTVGLNDRKNICAEEDTFLTDVPGVFAVGDAINKGPGIAIEAIGHAEKAARVVDSYLQGNLKPYRKPFYSIRKEDDNLKKALAEKPRADRVKILVRPAEKRKKDFEDIVIELPEDIVIAEASRCLECGCHDYEECRLIRTANDIPIEAERLSGEYHPSYKETRLETIERDQGKCILCNICVRTCNETAKQGILGLVGRGFTTVIRPEFQDKDTITICRDCRSCVNLCPTGALKYTN